ncbi:GNAT family N-acetyltransferase [Parasulfitobacter algicola]|uniref:GNAT family N-acetyltransferase n=1 Tax=Parasulfitobacter algicola TaxID=2614809 RepID=A0ABX2IU30_9RHOB|nr:GNAT family N-acetyltransferase [Sulfitobacter algicola]NSX56417.1 GNAT family N-acetyltransferase [Sulfitobacter algicola]
MDISSASHIRLGRVCEAEACAAILNDWIDATSWMPRVHTHDGVAQYFEDVMFLQHDVFVLGRPINGFLVLSPEGLVMALYVTTPGCGIGSKLLTHAKTQRAHLHLWTFQQNVDAQRFYKRQGFYEVRRTNGDNEEGLPDILYEWTRAA